MQGTQSIERIKRTRNVEPTEQVVMKRVHREGKRMRQEARAEQRSLKHNGA